MSACITDTLIKPREWVTQKERTRDFAERWELNLKMPFEDRSVVWKGILAPLTIGGMFSVQTRLGIVTDSGTTFGVTTDVEGDLAPEEAHFDVHMIDPVVPLPPLTCVLKAIKAGEAYEGEWSAPCASPETCGCAGLSDAIALTKFKDEFGKS